MSPTGRPALYRLSGARPHLRSRSPRRLPAPDPLERGRIRRPVSQAGRLIGVLLLVVGAGELVAALVDLGAGGPDVLPLAAAGAGTALAGGLLTAVSAPPQRGSMTELFSITAAGWLVFAVASAVPYLATGTVERLDDALFESIAGITTTAASVIDLTEASRGILLWRALSQWLGGAAVVTMALVVLPFLGTGESGFGHRPQALKSGRFLAHVRELVGPVLSVYLVFTAVTAAAYLAAGMGAFDAVAHSLTTVSTGGMSTRSGSLGAFASGAVELVAIAAMLVAGSSLALYVRTARGRRGGFLSSLELRVYLGVVAAGSALVIAAEVGGPESLPVTIRQGIFTVVSLVTTTGFTIEGLSGLSNGIQAVLLALMGVGAMSGSPSGGFRLLRLLALIAYIRRELVRQVHARAVYAVRVGRQVLAEDLLRRMVGYQAIFSVVAALGAIAVAALGTDVHSSVALAVSAIANVGPAFGEVTSAAEYAELNAPSRLVLMAVMLVGRLEIYPLLVGAGAVIDWLAPNRRRRYLQSRLAVYRRWR